MTILNEVIRIFLGALETPQGKKVIPVWIAVVIACCGIIFLCLAGVAYAMGYYFG